MIPSCIRREHILAVLTEIDRDGVPAGRSSRKFALVYEGRKYPPKYVVSLAAERVTGVKLRPSLFSGGSEANSFLRERGFCVVPVGGTKSPSIAAAKSPRNQAVRNGKPAPAPPHNERCADCKTAVESLLRVIYGAVESNYRIAASTNTRDYSQSPIHSSLSDIYVALQEHRGHKDFVRSASLPNCDFWIPEPGFILEFDESQHFTDCRALSLERYPSDMPFGFDKEKWLRNCRSIRAEDHDPPFRDEQRAWYDTLRDFVPLAQGFQPTLRLFSRELSWCSLNPEKARDVETFRQILGERASFWNVDFDADSEPILARVVIDGPWRGDVTIARLLLDEICAAWPQGKNVQCLTTCGAFLRFDWPNNLPKQVDNRFPDQEAIRVLEKEGKKCCDALLQSSLVGKLRSRTDILTLGVDSCKDKISSTQFYIPEPHVELVYVVDLATGAYHFTAKSYPTPGQEKGLLRNTNLENHFVDLGGNRTMVLGCHDLTIYNPRSDATATGWRADAKQEFKNVAAKYRPKWVLHHPHTTVKKRTWLADWKELTRSLPSVERYVGSGTYSRRDIGWDGRNGLSEVLASTRSKGVMDIIVHLAQP